MRHLAALTAASCLALALAPGRASALVLACESAPASFELLPRVGFNTYALGVSADGAFATGVSVVGNNAASEALRWNQAGAVERLERSVGWTNGHFLMGYEISDPLPSLGGERVVTGTKFDAAAPTYARWIGTTLQDTLIPSRFPGGVFFQQHPIDASPDGRYLVGREQGTDEAFLFDTETPLFQTMSAPALPAGANAVSDDGRVVAGHVSCGTSCTAPARWDDSVVTVLQGGDCAGSPGEVQDLSADGSVAAGWIANCPFGPRIRQPAIWLGNQLVPLGPVLPPTNQRDRGSALAVSPDGRFVVGTQDDLSGPAFLWDVEHGMRDLKLVLARDHALADEVAPWFFTAATGVTVKPDGRVVIVGYGWPVARTVGPGNFQPFRVTLDVDTPCDDADRDGLCDEWERDGYVDVNCDGRFDASQDLSLPGADPQHMDVYVELDTIEGTVVPTGALDDVVAAFASVPNSLVDNPGGGRGIRLHLRQDDAAVPDPGGGSNPSWTQGVGCGGATEFAAVKAEWFGTAAEQAADGEVLEVKRRLFRYGVLGGTFEELIEGQAVPFGPNFIVSPGQGFRTPTATDWAGIFMHELGHTLGLDHGGPEESVNYKPNYHSVMNYTWTTPAQLPVVGPPLGLLAYAGSWRLDYAREPFAMDLDENGLDEMAGLGGPQGHGRHFLPVGPLEGGPFSFDANPRIERAQGPIDFDRDGVPNEAVSGPANLNQVNPWNAPDFGNPRLEILEAHSDWDYIALFYPRFFQHPNWFGAGACVGFLRTFPPPDELTVAERVGLSVDMPIDCNGNGVDDDDELLQGLAADDDGDGWLDACEPRIGDCDGDDDIDLADRGLVVAAFGRSEGEAAYLECADLDGDRDVTFVDYQAWVAEYEAAQPPAGSCGGAGGGEAALLAGAWLWHRQRRMRGGVS